MKTFLFLAFLSSASITASADDNRRNNADGQCSNLCECILKQNWGNGSYYDWSVYKRGTLVANGRDAVMGEQEARKVCRAWTVTQTTCYE